MGTVADIILISVLIAVGTAIYWLARFCIRAGAKRAMNDIVRGFREVVPPITGELQLFVERDLDQSIKDCSFSYPLDWRLSEAQANVTAIGRTLGEIGSYSGQLLEQEMRRPKKDEAEVRMKREDLEQIAWLADQGYRLHIDPCYEGLRSGERFSKEEAQLAARRLDDFDRDLVEDLLLEAPEDKEWRFTRYENRIKDQVWFYPD